MAKRRPNLHEQLTQSVLLDPEARAEYEAFKIQLEVAEKMKAYRKKAHLTQQDVADRMKTKKSAIARVEAAGGRGKHSPSLNTLSKYAQAIGYRLEIKLKKAS